MKGTETLKKNINLLIQIAEKVDESLEDGNLNIIEGIGIALQAVKAWGLVKDIDVMKAEYSDLDDLEKAELWSYFVDEFDLRSDKIEYIVEAVFSLLLEMSSFVKLVSDK